MERQLKHKQVLLYNSLSELFNNKVWSLYASYISSKTVCGPNAYLEKEQQKANILKYHPAAIKNIEEYSNRISRNKLKPTWSMANQVYKNTYTNKKLNDAIKRIQSI